jgi:hypothetical protein
MKALTILLTRNSEQSDEYLELYLNSLCEWSADALPDVQLLVLSQKLHDKFAWNKCYSTPFPRGFSIDMIPIKYDRVKDYPVWDVLHDWRTAWPFVEGKWVTANHPEYLWLPGRMRQTVNYLKAERAELVLGNLRRPGVIDALGDNKILAGGQEISNNLMDQLRFGQWRNMQRAVENVPTAHWLYWRDEPKPDSSVPWIEDVFFAQKAWLDEWYMLAHGGRLPFQDVYDLMGAAVPLLLQHEMMFPVRRVPESINKIIHLRHPKSWGSWTESMRDWFLADKQWKGTRFHDRGLWDRLIAAAEQGMSSDLPMIDLRYPEGGTVYRYRQALESWINELLYEQRKA